MPSSRPDHLPALAYLLERVRPKHILDIGIGSGFKGAFFREYTDVWNHGVIAPVDNIGIDLVGIEIWPHYRNRLWDLYDHVYEQDALSALAGFGEEAFDLVHAGDVIEHMSRSDGRTLIKEMARVARHTAIIVTPVIVKKQGAVYGNKHEAHISQWHESDFPGWTRESFGNVAMFVLEK